MGVFQITFSESLHLSGGFWLGEALPFRFGPRHQGQSVELTELAAILTDVAGSVATAVCVAGTIRETTIANIAIRGIVGNSLQTVIIENQNRTASCPERLDEIRVGKRSPVP